jgi:hypothetical protein
MTPPPRLLERSQGWLERLPLAAFAGIALALGIIKTGIRLDPLPGSDAQFFPQPPNSFSATAFGLRGLVWLLTPNSSLGFVIMGLVVVAVVIAVSTATFHRLLTNEASRILLLVLLVGPIGGTLYTTIGQNDSLLILGSLIVAVSGKKITVSALGLAIMILANPEQTVVAWSVLLIMSFTPILREWRRYASYGLIVAFAGFLAISVGVRAAGAGDKTQFLDDFLLQSVHNFASNLPLSLYALFGFSWPLVLVLVYTQGARTALVGALALVPAIVVTAVTVDQTRVLVGVTTMATLTWMISSLKKVDSGSFRFSISNRLAWMFLLALVLPSVMVFGPSGLPWGPYSWVFHALFSGEPLW